MKQLCNRKVGDFAMALRARKVSGAFEKWPPGLKVNQCILFQDIANKCVELHTDQSCKQEKRKSQKCMPYFQSSERELMKKLSLQRTAHRSCFNTVQTFHPWGFFSTR